MHVTINGRPQELSPDKNLSDIVSAFSKHPRHVVSELNGSIVPFGQWTQTSLKDGDALELVTFVGGG